MDWGDGGQRVQTCSQKMNKFWRAGAQRYGYGYQYCVIYFKVVLCYILKRLDLKFSHHSIK